MGWDAEGDTFFVDGGVCEIEFCGGLGVCHGSEDGDFLAGPGVEGFGGAFVDVACAEGGDFEFGPFPGDAGFFEAEFEGGIGV